MFTQDPSKFDRTRAGDLIIVDSPALTDASTSRPAVGDERLVIPPLVEEQADQRLPDLRGFAYCRSSLKRTMDVGISLVALVLLLPLLLAVALLVLLTSNGPVLFAQERVGLDGRRFRLLKFRSMRAGADDGSLITARGDCRITRVGRHLRAFKIDELPQFVNVLRGEMSVVGPRPLIPCYYMSYTAEQRRVLEVLPGLTDPATLHFRDEESILLAIPEGEREAFYRSTILQKKLALNLGYIEKASFPYDLRLIFETALTLVPPIRRAVTRRAVTRRAVSARITES